MSIIMRFANSTSHHPQIKKAKFDQGQFLDLFFNKNLMDISEEKIKMLNSRYHHDVNEAQHEAPVSGTRKKGGFITMPFILANEAFERVASYGLTPNLIVYLMEAYKMSVSSAQNLINGWNAISGFTPLIGAVLADTLLGRFLTIGIGSIFSLLGMTVLWLTTIIPQAKPPPCDVLVDNCESSTIGQYAFLIFGFVLMSIGTGGIRPCSQTFGADQMDQGDHSKKKNSLEMFLNWYCVFCLVSLLIAFTVIVYIQEHFGWIIGFGVPVILMFLATLSFFLAAPFYVMVKCDKNLLLGLAQVIVATFKNRNVNMSDLSSSDVQYYHDKDSVASTPTHRLRFLNKACMIQNPDKDICPNGLARDPWSLCKVDDVEGLKAFIRVIPIWSAGIVVSINTSLGSFSLLLIKTMDRHIGSSFEIPAASFSSFMIIVIAIWIPLYDQVFIPLASKIYGKPFRLDVNLRMGIGLFFSFMSILVAGIVESIRREKAINEGFENDPQGVVSMSALWTTISFFFGGIAEAFFLVAQSEFFLSELPKNMLSIALSIFTLTYTFGGLLASTLFNFTDYITKRGGHEGWLTTNVNKGHYDYYYFLVASINILNLLYYVYCSRVYGPTVAQQKKTVGISEDSDEAVPLLKDTGS